MEPVRVLYVEDDPADQELTRRHLERHAPHLKLRVVETVAEALDQLGRGDLDLVLADYRLPDGTGLDLLEAIKAREFRVPVVLVTGSRDVESAVRLLKAGAADYVVKRPGHVQTLPSVLEGAFQRFRLAGELRRAAVRVLYAEHDPADVELMHRTFREYGLHFELEVACGGQEALERLRSAPYDLFLLDYRMPDLSGIEILKALREERIRVPVVMITGQEDEETAVQAFKLGVADYIIKRESYSTKLPSTLENVLAQRRLAEEKDALVVLNGLTESISALQDPSQLVHRVARAAADLLQAEMSILWLVEGSELRPAGSAGIEDPAAQELGFRVEKHLLERAAVERQVAIPDLLAGAGSPPPIAAVLERAGGTLAVSLVIAGQVVGLLAVASHRPREFRPTEERFLTILADHSAIAIENARQIQEMTSLLEISKASSSTLDLLQLLKVVAQKTASGCQVDRCTIFLWEDGYVIPAMSQFASGSLRRRMWKAFTKLGRYRVEEIPLFTETIHHKRVIVVTDTATSDLVPRQWIDEFRIHSFVAVPLLARERVVGSFHIEYTEAGYSFSKAQIDLATTVAGQMALALDNGRLYEETQQRLRQTKILLAVAQAIGSTLDLTEIARRTVREIVRALGANVGGVWLLSPSRDQLIPLAGYHVPKELVETFSRTPLPLGDRLIEEARRLAGPICSSDSQADPRFDHPLARLLPHKSVLVHPIWVKGEIIGGFAIVWVREAHRFTSEQLRLVEGIARQAAVAIENARLMEAEREAREQLKLSGIRYRELFENIRDIVYLHDLEGRLLAVNDAAVRASGYTRNELLRMNVAQLIAPEELARQAELIRRMIAGERVPEFFTAEFIRKDGTRTILECSGRLIFRDGVPAAVEGIARDITVRRKLEQRQAAVVEIVKELAEEDDFERLFSLLGEHVCRLMGTDSAALSLVEGDEVVLRGFYGVDELGPAAQRRNLSQSRVGRVVLTRKPHASADMATDPHWKESRVVTELGYRAVLEVPVILRGEVIAVLGAWHKSPRAFSPEDVALLVSLAGHTAAALDRTNLVRELKARLRESQTLLTVSQAVSSTLDLTETMRRVARETCRALGADMVGAFLADAAREFLRPIAGYHVPKHLLGAFMESPVPLKGHRALEEAWEHHRPIYSSDAEADLRLDRETIQRFPQRSVLFVPMVVKGNPIGGLFVTWWEQKHNFTPEELRLVEGISHQAALAIENAQLYREAREVAERLRLLGQAVASLAEVVVVTSLDGQVIFVNEAIKAVFGCSPQEALGKHARFLWAPSTPKGQKKLVTDATLAGGWQGEVRGVRADGAEFPVALTTAPVRDESGQPVVFVGVVRDLSSEKALQAQIVQSEKLAAMGSLLAGVAHELNNPLSVILGQTALLLRTVGRGALAQRAERISKAAERCARIVRSFLALARQHPPERQQVQLNQVVQEAVELLAYPLRVDNVEVRLDLALGLPILWADPHQLHQVVVNLVTNAHLAMREVPPPRRLTLTSRSDPAHRRVSLEVADTGPGIPPEIQGRIFEPFFTTRPPGQGTGLGLSLCLGIIEEHKGTIRVESQPGHGAVFRIELPVDARCGAVLETPTTEALLPIRGKAILVVDDEPEIVDLLAEMLAADGHQVETAANGARALEKLQKSDFDLILSDIRMPELDGPGLYQELESRYPDLRRRVIFLTGDTLSPETREFLKQIGAQSLSKPFHHQEVRAALQRILQTQV